MDLFYEIALTQVPKLGLKRVRVLLDTFGSAEAVFAAPRDAFDNTGPVQKYLFDEHGRGEAMRRAEKEMEFISKNSINAIHITDSRYPYRLAQCSDAPVILYTVGSDTFPSKHYVAVVGTRSCTAYGRNITEKFVRELAAMLPDVTIGSGLAYGIDVCSHKAALENGATTIGVVAHGLDMIYPPAHRSVAATIVERGGAIVTEYISKTWPEAGNFVQRNRIIAGLCDAVVVVESAIKGGALLTAKAAGGYSRDVFAFPGRVGDKASAGCNMLLRTMQAGLIESAEDLVKAERWVAVRRETEQPLFAPEMKEEYKQIYDALKGETLHIADLALKVNMKTAALMPLLIEMEMEGIIEGIAGGRYRNVIL